MSNYNFKAKDKQTGEVLEFEAMDDYFGRHKYGYKRADTDNGIVWTEKEFNQDFERIDEDQDYILRRDGKFLEFTEDEVRELAGQLPDDKLYEFFQEMYPEHNIVYKQEVIEDAVETLKGESNYKTQPKVRIKSSGEVKRVNTIHYYPNESICVGYEYRYYRFDEIEFITDDKISPGTTTAHRIKMQSEQNSMDKCANCGEPKPPINSKYCGRACHEEAINTKPDPIEPLDLLYEYGSDKSTEQQIKEATGELARKQREIIERINLLSNHE